MKEKNSELKSYQYPDVEILYVGDMDIVTFSGTSFEGTSYDSDENQGEWD